MTRQTFVERKRNTGTNTRGKSRQKLPADHWHGGNEMRKRQIPGMEGDTTYRLVLPTTPFLKLFGWGYRVSPAGLPIELVLGEYSLS